MEEIETPLPKLDKPATTYDQQFDILKNDKKMTITEEDRKEVTDFLKHVHYFRLSGYWMNYYEEKDKLKENISFKKIKNTYVFEKKLKNLLLYVIETIEIEMRSQIGYTFSHECNPLGYNNKMYFKNEEYMSEWVEKFSKSLEEIRSNDELYKEWYKREYDGRFPLWVIFEMCSINDVSKFYSNLKDKEKKKMTPFFGYKHEMVSSWLHSVVIIRNICAHNGRFFGRTISVSPKLPSDAKYRNLNTKRLFIVIVVMKKLCRDKKTWSVFFSGLINLITEYPDVDIEFFGFPNNWYDILSES